MPVFEVTQSERYRAVYLVVAETADEAQRMIEEGEIDNGEAYTFDLVGADVIEVQELEAAN